MRRSRGSWAILLLGPLVLVLVLIAHSVTHNRQAIELKSSSSSNKDDDLGNQQQRIIALLKSQEQKLRQRAKSAREGRHKLSVALHKHRSASSFLRSALRQENADEQRLLADVLGDRNQRISGDRSQVLGDKQLVTVLRKAILDDYSWEDSEESADGEEGVRNGGVEEEERSADAEQETTPAEDESSIEEPQEPNVEPEEKEQPDVQPSAQEEQEPTIEAPTQDPTEQQEQGEEEPAVVEPVEAPVEAPAEAPVEAPAEAPAEAPVEAPAEAPVEAPAEAPAEAPTEAPVEAPTEAPTVAPVEAPAEAPVEAPSYVDVEQTSNEPSVQPPIAGRPRRTRTTTPNAANFKKRRRGRVPYPNTDPLVSDPSESRDDAHVSAHSGEQHPFVPYRDGRKIPWEWQPGVEGVTEEDEIDGMLGLGGRKSTHAPVADSVDDHDGKLRRVGVLTSKAPGWDDMDFKQDHKDRLRKYFGVSTDRLPGYGSRYASKLPIPGFARDDHEHLPWDGHRGVHDSGMRMVDQYKVRTAVANPLIYSQSATGADAATQPYQWVDGQEDTFTDKDVASRHDPLTDLLKPQERNNVLQRRGVNVGNGNLWTSFVRGLETSFGTSSDF